MARTKTKDARTIQLNSGGQVTVILEGNVFDLSGADRNFVNSLTEMIQSYETAEQSSIPIADREVSSPDGEDVL